MKTSIAALLAAASSLCASAAFAQAPAPAPAARPPAPPMKIEQIKPDLYFITGGGGNSELLVTKDGALLVDDKYFAQKSYDDLMKIIAGVTDKPVKYVVVTHHHADHTGNNERFLAAGAKVIGNQNMPDILKNYTTTLMDHNPPPPNVTFDKTYDVKLGKTAAKLYHFGPGHTGADTVVLFPKDKAIAFGDLVVMAPTYPNYDAGVGGGSLLGLQHSLGEALKLKWDIAFPGHGDKPLTRDEVVEYKKKIDQLISRIKEAIEAGTPKNQLIQSIQTDDLGWKIGGTFWAPPARVDALVAELSKK